MCFRFSAKIFQPVIVCTNKIQRIKKFYDWYFFCEKTVAYPFKAFNLVTKFEKKRLTFVAVIARKRSVTDRRTDRQMDRQTDKPKLITPLFSSKKRGITNISSR